MNRPPYGVWVGVVLSRNHPDFTGGVLVAVYFGVIQ